MIEALQVADGRHGTGREQRADLRTEVELIVLARPMQRADADAIAGEEQRALPQVHQGERELALQMLEQALAVLLVEMDDILGIGMRAEDVTLGLQQRSLLGVVEQLALVHDGDCAILVEDRLAAIGAPDDLQAALADAHTLGKEPAVLVRPPMHNGRSHAPQSPAVRLALATEVDNASKTTHSGGVQSYRTRLGTPDTHLEARPSPLTESCRSYRCKERSLARLTCVHTLSARFTGRALPAQSAQ